MSERLVHYLHPTAGFALPVPSEWERVEDPGQGVALVAVEPDRGPWFRANAVVTIERVPAGLQLTAWHDSALAMMPAALDEFLLIDVEDVRLGDRAARRALAHHSTEVGAVTAESWALVEADVGYTLTASVGTLEYNDLAEMFAAMAQGFRLNPQWTPG